MVEVVAMSSAGAEAVRWRGGESDSRRRIWRTMRGGGSIHGSARLVAAAAVGGMWRQRGARAHRPAEAHAAV